MKIHGGTSTNKSAEEDWQSTYFLLSLSLQEMGSELNKSFPSSKYIWSMWENMQTDLSPRTLMTKLSWSVLTLLMVSQLDSTLLVIVPLKKRQIFHHKEFKGFPTDCCDGSSRWVPGQLSSGTVWPERGTIKIKICLRQKRRKLFQC